MPGVLACGASKDVAVALVQALALRVVAGRLEHDEAGREYLGISFDRMERDGRHEVRRMTPPTLGPKFEEALLLAVRVQGGQLRKGAAEIPYVSHLLSVCALVLEDGGDEDEAIAALLHDTLEDRPEEVTRSGLVRRFGTRVADLVAACTDTPPDYRGGPKAPWPGRKAAYVERIREEPYPLCRVALADKLHNTRCVVLDHRRFGDKIWKEFKESKADQIRHHRALVDAFRAAKAPEYLVDELDSLVKELEASEVGA